MAIGLKMKDIRRFGQKVQKGVATFGRKLAKTAEQVGSVVSPLATVIAGPEAGLAVEGAVRGVSGFGRGLEKTGKAVDKGIGAFKKIQNPILGAQELTKAIKGARTNDTEGTKMRIGDITVRRFGAKNRGIQRTEPGEEPMMNDWAPDLPFANINM